MASGKIRVLIVDDIAETRENIKKLLQFETDIEVVGAARSGKEGIQLAQELDPDVVLMDINMPDIDGISATEIIRQKTPYIQVVILSVQSDQNYMRRAMLAGARDFLTKPPMGDELISAVRRAAENARTERSKDVPARVVSAGASGVSAVGTSALPAVNGKIISVYSPKGGVGCTTVAVNLAIALHNEDTKVVLVDSNIQFGDVAIFMNEQGKNTFSELAPRVDQLEAEVVESILIKHSSTGVRILAAPQKPDLEETVTADQFEKVISYLKQMYAYVVIDTTSVLTDIAKVAVSLSDVILLVVTQEIPSIKSARLFLDLLQMNNFDSNRILFVMNKFDKRISITPERVGENLKQPVTAVIPFDERIVVPSVNRGVPFMVDNKTQPVGRGIYAIAEGVRARINSLEAESVKPKR